MGKKLFVYVEETDKKQFFLGTIHPNNLNSWYDECIQRIKMGTDIKIREFWEDEEIEMYEQAKSRGLTRVNIEDIINVPRDKSFDYNGVLPKYAQDAPRQQIVKIFCKECKKTRFGMLNKNYPGKDILKSANIEEYEAKCLMCGKFAIDNYNWHR